MNEVIRQEKKFILTLEECYKYSDKLAKFMMEDSHNGSNGYLIRSLYFDSIYDRDFSEKEDGVEIRRKLRLRIYNQSQDAMFELKQKEGQNQLKRSLALKKEDAVLISKGDYSPLLKYEEPFAAECYGVLNMYGYLPKTVVQYNRKAFIGKENKTRITFDSNVESTESCFDIFSPSLNMNPVIDKFNVILEVKYDGFLLNYIQQLINVVDKSEISVSKYCMARQIGYNYRF